jgi:hypothetical protein
MQTSPASMQQPTSTFENSIEFLRLMREKYCTPKTNTPPTPKTTFATELTSKKKKRNYNEAFDQINYDNARYGIQISHDYFKKNIGHNAS